MDGSNNIPHVPIINSDNISNISLQVEVLNIPVQENASSGDSSGEEQIEHITPANIADSVVDFIRNLMENNILNDPTDISPILPPTQFRATRSIWGEYTNELNSNQNLSNLFSNSILGGRTLVRSFEEDKATYKHVLSEKGNQEIDLVSFSSEKFKKQDTCVFTMIPFEEGETVAKLPCNHIFNQKAILKWLKEEKATCPVCRFKLDSKEVKNDDTKTCSRNEHTSPQGIHQNRSLSSFVRNIEFIQHPTRILSSDDSSGGSVEAVSLPMRRRNISTRRLAYLMRMMDREEEEREEQELQQAIFASLQSIQDASGNTSESIDEN